MAARMRKAATNAAFQPDICQIILVSFKILTQLPSSQPVALGGYRRGTRTESESAKARQIAAPTHQPHEIGMWDSRKSGYHIA
jgi:hypothetical protein